MTQPAPPRVLHVFGRMQPGGAELRLLELMGRLCPHEFRVDVCALSGLPGRLDDGVRALGGQVWPIRLDPAFPARFLRLLATQRYTVVHSHVLFASGPILALAVAGGVPIRVAHFHATGDGRVPSLRRRLERRTARWLIDRCATDIIACGQGSMCAVWREDWHRDPRCRVVYDAVDPARFAPTADRDGLRRALGIPPGAVAVLHVGNEVAEKNHRRVLAIFAAIRAASPASRLLLVGDRTDDPAGVSHAAIRALGLEGSVLPLGIRDDVPALLQAADVLLLPSIREGLPGIVLEACAAGTPVLAADLPGVREVAARLALVQYLPLEVADPEWARLALTLPQQSVARDLRRTAAAAFGASVFDLSRAVAAHRELWSGGRAGGEYACA